MNYLQQQKHADYIPMDYNPLCTGNQGCPSNAYYFVDEDDMQKAKTVGWPLSMADGYSMDQISSVTESAAKSLVKNACEASVGCSTVLIHYECGQDYEGTPLEYEKCGTTESYNCECNGQ